MDKPSLRTMLERATARYLDIYGGEVVRYASPSQVKLKLGSYRKVPNLKEAAYRAELRRAEDERGNHTGGVA